MSALAQDLRYALRTLAKSPGFTAVAVATLALGIGASTAIFSLVDAVLLRPLPYPQSERLMLVWDAQPAYGDAPASWLEFLEWRKALRCFDRLTGFFNRNVNLSGAGEPERIREALVARDFFEVVGATPELGRRFLPSEHAEGAPRVAVVSHAFWQQHFGGDRSAVGRPVLLDDVAFTVVGVLRSGAPDFSERTPTSVWIPLEATPPWRDRGSHYLTVLGRLRPGETLAQARAEASSLARSLDAQYHTGHGLRVTELRDRYVGDARPLLTALFGAVGLVLLIATANVANLLLARSSGRIAEFAIRSALGASRLRLVRQTLTESVVLGVFGGLVGVALGAWTVPFIVAAWPPGVPRPLDVDLDARVLAFAAALSIGAAILFGLAPTLLGDRAGLVPTLKGGAGSVGSSQTSRRFRHAVVAGELALALVLLVGSALMVRSFLQLVRVDPGFRTDHLLTFDLNLTERRYPESTRQPFFETLAARLSSIPGVTGVAAANNLPLSSAMNGDFRIEGRPPFPPGTSPNAEKRIVTPSYFAVLGIPILEGRGFTRTDGEGGHAVVVINRSMAKRFWPAQSPVGHRLKVLACGDDCWEEIVGVAGDVKVSGLDQPAGYEVYIPFREIPLSGMVLAVRTAADPVRVAAMLRPLVAEIDRSQPIFDVRTMDDILASSVAGRRLSAVLLSCAGGLALLLAVVGVAGVAAYAVSRRTREIGLRMALGATSREILAHFLAQSLRLVLTGVAIGLPAAVLLARVLRAQLFEVSLIDPVALLGAPTLLAAAAMVASLVSARQATRVDPMVALRSE